MHAGPKVRCGTHFMKARAQSTLLAHTNRLHTMLRRQMFGINGKYEKMWLRRSLSPKTIAPTLGGKKEQLPGVTQHQDLSTAYLHTGPP